ncbi:DUF3231 family protein [Brevibacillus sp. SYSU BS000544]|uniref:DUF3231 family protein n=1 Tax=Brevibacillus sp. SYSU BS000544 TaxID=3416443 RepID=UPI003CE5707C
MQENKQIKLTSAEISQLWSMYMNDSAAFPILTYFLNKVEDREIKSLLESSVQICQLHLQKFAEFFKGEGIPVPHGFTIEKDVDLHAPKLFSDTYVLNFLHHLLKVGLHAQSINLSVATRKDVSTFFADCIIRDIELYERIKDALLSKGLYIRAPHIPAPKQVDFVKDQGFLTGFFGEKRPLTVTEITPLYTNLIRNALGVATMIGFSQVSQDREVTQFLLRGRDIAKKHCDIFGSALKESYLPVPMTWDSEVTETTQRVFSDKLMMHVTTALIGVSIQYYGLAITMSPRRDLGQMYNRLIAEIQLFAEDGANLMIKHGWLEEAPKAPDRNELANEKRETEIYAL